MSDDLIEEVREMGEHPSRADLPMGKTLRNTAEYMEALEGQVQSWTEEARRYAENADYWRAKCEALRADKAAHAATIEGILKAHEAYKQEVSDAVEHCRACSDPEAWTRIKFELERFIISKPDPLADAWIEATGNTVGMGPLNEALAKRGLKIVETEQ